MSEPLLSSIHDETAPAVAEDWPGRDPAAVAPEPVSDAGPPTGDIAQGMIPGRSRRRTKLERASMRTLATGGIVGIATALGAVLVNNDVAGWIVGLAVGVTSVTLAAVLWSSRQL
jgi:hypothetical protein